MNTSSSRRQFVKETVAGMGLMSLASLSQAQAPSDIKPLKVVCCGGHPDDPESGCGGTLAKFAAAGHSVTIIYLTRGESGIKHKTHDESAAIRSKEAEAACQILKAKPLFAGQIDGDTIVNHEWVLKVQALIEDEKPDLVFTQWPIDFHKDHQVCSLLTFQVWAKAKNKFQLYFYEVCTGEQSMIFKPTDYVDISGVQEQKRQAVYCHVSQKPPTIYESSVHGAGHAIMEQFRGCEIGVAAAEAFVKLNGMKQGNTIPGL